MRSTFEQLGVVLPPRRISLRAKAFHISASWSVDNLTVVGGSKVGAPSEVVSTLDASAMGSSLRKAGRQLGVGPLPCKVSPPAGEDF